MISFGLKRFLAVFSKLLSRMFLYCDVVIIIVCVFLIKKYIHSLCLYYNGQGKPKQRVSLGHPLTMFHTSLHRLLAHLMTSTVGSNSPSPYIPKDNILLDCGSDSHSTALDGQTWIGDENSIFFLVQHASLKQCISNCKRCAAILLCYPTTLYNSPYISLCI